MIKVLRDIGAGLAFTIGVGTAIHLADDVSGNHLKSLAVRFENAVIQGAPETTKNAFQASVASHPASTLDLAFFVFGVPLGAIGYRKLVNREEKNNPKPKL